MKKILTRLKRRHLVSLICLLGADGIVFGATNPRTAPSLLLIVGFLLFIATSYVLLKALLAIPAIYGLKIRHKHRLLGTLTAFTGAVVALQSIGQLSFRDVLVLSILTTLLYLYVAYAKSMRQNFQLKQP